MCHDTKEGLSPGRCAVHRLGSGQHGRVALGLSRGVVHALLSRAVIVLMALTGVLSAGESPVFMPRPLPYSASSGLRLQGFERSSLRGQEGDLRLSRMAVDITVPIGSGSPNQYAVVMAYDRLALDGQAELPQSGAVPDSLERLRCELSWKRMLDEAGRSVGLALSIGNASDELFASSRDLTYGVTAVAYLPREDGHAWQLGLLWRSDLRLLDGYPVPMAVYHIRSPTLHLQLGLPVVHVRWSPDPAFSVSGGWLVSGPTVAATLRPDPAWEISARVAGDGFSAWRHDREQRDDLLRYRDYAATLSLAWQPFHGQRLAVNGGWRFYRRLSEDDGGMPFRGEDNRLRIADGWFIGLEGRISLR